MSIPSHVFKGPTHYLCYVADRIYELSYDLYFERESINRLLIALPRTKLLHPALRGEECEAQIQFEDLGTLRGILGDLYSECGQGDTAPAHAWEDWLLSTDAELKAVQHQSVIDLLGRFA